MSSTAVPAQLGRYRILSKLGQGGMGAVYLAEDTTLSRRVAVKVPHFNEADGPKVIECFQREARVAAAIDHPNLCPVHDCGEVNGVYFLVMPYIEGTPLSHLIDEDDLWPPARAAVLVRQLALAVEVLHQRGLIHRDSAEAAGNRRRSTSIIGVWRENPQDRPHPCHRAAMAAPTYPCA